METATIVTLAVSVLLFMGGIVISLYSFATMKRVDGIQHELSELMKASTANTTNISSLASAVDHLREIVEEHIIHNGRIK